MWGLEENFDAEGEVWADVEDEAKAGAEGGLVEEKAEAKEKG